MTRIPLFRPGGRRRRFGGCLFHSLHTKKGLSGQQPHLHARRQQARKCSHKCSRRHHKPHSTPRTAVSERRRGKDRRKAVFRDIVAKRNTNRRVIPQIQGKIPPKFGLSPRKHPLTHPGRFQGQITAKKWISLFRQRFGEVASVVSTGHRWLLRGREVSFRSAKGTQVATGFFKEGPRSADWSIGGKRLI